MLAKREQKCLEKKKEKNKQTNKKTKQNKNKKQNKTKKKNPWKITIFVKMWNLGQYREILIFCQ